MLPDYRPWITARFPTRDVKFDLGIPSPNCRNLGQIALRAPVKFAQLTSNTDWRRWRTLIGRLINFGLVEVKIDLKVR